jgi:hypothetical protein
VGSCNLFAVISNHFGKRVEAELILKNHFWTQNWFVSKGREKKGMVLVLVVMLVGGFL